MNMTGEQLLYPPVQLLPVFDRYRSIKSIQRYWTFIVQLLFLISEGHSHGNQLSNHQHCVHLTELEKSHF